MIFIQLFLAFLKIGALSFGGGYAMIPFFEREIATHLWTAASDYTGMIAIAQVFPGPFAIDSSAYIGFKTAGLLGAVIASAALSLPSFIALMFITRSYIKFKANKYIQMVLGGVRPIVIGLLASSAYIIGIKPLMKPILENPSATGSAASLFTAAIPLLKALPLVVAGFLLLKYTKINPIIFILIFAVIGILLF